MTPVIVINGFMQHLTRSIAGLYLSFFGIALLFISIITPSFFMNIYDNPRFSPFYNDQPFYNDHDVNLSSKWDNIIVFSLHLSASRHLPPCRVELRSKPGHGCPGWVDCNSRSAPPPRSAWGADRRQSVNRRGRDHGVSSVLARPSANSGSWSSRHFVLQSSQRDPVSDCSTPCTGLQQLRKGVPLCVVETILRHYQRPVSGVGIEDPVRNDTRFQRPGVENSHPAIYI